MFLKKTIAALAAGCLAFSLASCSNSESSSEAGGSTQSANYITARGSEPQNPLIPGNTNEVGGGNIVDLIYSGLVYYDAVIPTTTWQSPSTSKARRPTA